MSSLFAGLMGSTPLHTAVKKCQLAEVQHLVQKGAQIDAKDKDGCTPLHIAAERGFAPIVTELLNRLATATLTNNDQRTPVHEAARGGHAAVLSLLLGSQNKRDAQHTKLALVNSVDKAGQTPLMLAIQNRHLSVAQELIRLGADLNRQDAAGNTAFMAAVRRGDIDTMVSLYTCGSSLEHPRTPMEGWSPLHVAAAVGQEAAARWLVERGASLDTRDNQARTPWSVAIAHEQQTLAQYLRAAAQQRGALPSNFNLAAPAATYPPAGAYTAYPVAGGPAKASAGDAGMGAGAGALPRSKLQVLAQSEEVYYQGSNPTPGTVSQQAGVGPAGGRGSDGGAYAAGPVGAASGASLVQQWAEQQQRLANQAGAPTNAAYPQLPPGATVYY